MKKYDKKYIHVIMYTTQFRLSESCLIFLFKTAFYEFERLNNFFKKTVLRNTMHKKTISPLILLKI